MKADNHELKNDVDRLEDELANLQKAFAEPDAII